MPLFWLIIALLGGATLYAFAKAGPKLDSGVSADQRKAITFAYLHEKNPQNLREFGQALLPDLPISAKLLLTKAASLTPKAGPSSSPTASPLTPVSNVRSTSRLSAISGVTIGNIFDVDNYTDAAGKVVSTTIDVVTHPADTASGTWHAITHPSQSISDFGNALADALHAVPGMDEAGELLKDFAKTGFGEWTLRILATVGYYVMAPYLGAQLAAISFALPGVARAEPFTQAWITETIDRVIKTINILLQQEGLRNIGSSTSEALNKALAENPVVQKIVKAFTEEMGKANSVLIDKLGPEIANKLKSGANDAFSSVTKKLAAEYGLPPDFSKLASQAGIREDNAAAAYDLVAKTHYQATTAWDPVTGEDIEAHLRKARFQDVQKAGSASYAKAYQDPRLLSVQEAAAKRVLSVANLLNPPARKKWVDYYLNQERYAEAGVQAKSTPNASIGYAGPSSHAFIGIVPGSYRFEVETLRQIDPYWVPQILNRYGVAPATIIREIPSGYPHLRRYEFASRIGRPMRLQNIPGFRWALTRKLPPN